MDELFDRIYDEQMQCGRSATCSRQEAAPHKRPLARRVAVFAEEAKEYRRFARFAFGVFPDRRVGAFFLACFAFFVHARKSGFLFGRFYMFLSHLQKKCLFSWSLVAVLAVAGTASADEHKWKVATGEFGTAANWTPAGPLAAADIATISNNGAATVSGSYTTDLDYVFVGGYQTVGVGTLNVTSTGNLDFYTAVPASNAQIMVGYKATSGSYGTMNSAGTVKTDTINLGWNNGSTGTFNLTGGTTTNKSLMRIGYDGIGETNVGGGTLTAPALYIAQRGTAAGTLNLSGTGSVVVNGTCTAGGASGAASIVNLGALGLGGGTLRANTLAATAGSTSLVNFHGGVLQARAITSNLLNGTTNYVYGEGAVIDTSLVADGTNVIVTSKLLAPTGNGLSSITLVGGGSGYLNPPVVKITGGGGVGATANAVINSSGAVTGFVITNPGTGYTSDATVTLIGGGGAGASGTVTLADSNYAANISGGLRKYGTGRLFLTADNTYTGTTKVESGSLWFGANGTAGSVAGPIEVSTDATLVVYRGNTTTIGNLISGGGNLTKYLPNTVVLTNSNTYSGTTTFLIDGTNKGGVIQADDGVGLPANSFLDLKSGGVLQSNSDATFKRSLGTSGNTFQWGGDSGGFSAGAGAMNVRIGDSTSTVDWGYTIGSQIVGTLQLGSVSAANVTTFENGINLNGAARTVQVDDNTATLADYAVISGNIVNNDIYSVAGLIKTGAGLLKLSGANTYDGDTVISGGALQASGGASLPSGFLSLDGGVLQSNSNVVFTRVLGASGSNAFQWTYNGGGFSAGAGTMNVRIGDSTSSVDWTTSIFGVLKLSSTSAGAVTTFENAIDLKGDQTIQVDDNPFSTNDWAVMAGVITDSYSLYGLTKTGAGKLVLGAANTYPGLTKVSAGTLAYGISDALYTGGVTVTGATAVLDIGNYSDSVGAVILDNGGSITGTGVLASTATFDVRSGSAGAILNGTLGLTKTLTGTVVLSGVNTYSGDTTISAGALQADDGAGLPNGSFLSLDGGVLQSNGNVIFTRSLGAGGGNTFQWTYNGGGFSAGAGTMNVRIGGGTSAVNWGYASGSEIVGTLKFGSATANNVTTFENGINLNGSVRTIQVDNNTASTADWADISGVIADGSSALSGITKEGAGILRLSNAANSYTGPTTINGGVLEAVKIDAAGANSSLGAATADAANLVIGNATLKYVGAASASTDRGFTTAGTSIFETAANLTISGPIVSPATTTTFTKTGTGKLTLTNPGANTLATHTTGASTTVNNGVLVFDGGGASIYNIGRLVVADTASSNAAVYQASGAVDSAASTSGYWTVGLNGYGYYKLSGGTVNLGTRPLIVGDTTGTGVLDITGGSFTTGNYHGYLANQAASVGILNVSNGGSFTCPGTGSYRFNVGTRGYAVINLGGGGSITAAPSTYMSMFAGSVTIINLGTVGNPGGTYSTQAFYVTGAAGKAAVNFHGGTARVTASYANFFQDVPTYIYSEGATIDTNGFDITIAAAQPLKTPAGSNGVTIASTPASPGVGYIGTPVVKITNASGDTTGFGATAVATVDLDPASSHFGEVTGFTITNPGTGYTAVPTIELIGGGATAPATVGIVALSANSASGGLTKIGGGQLTLAGLNTYTGPTTIDGGILALASTGDIASSASITNNATFTVLAGSHATNAISGIGATRVVGSASLTAPSLVQNSLVIDGSAPSAGAVPEPSTLVLLALAGLASFGAYHRRK
jgi:fibronectin-binding autotransporter adhesin